VRKSLLVAALALQSAAIWAAPTEVTFDGDWTGFGSLFQKAGPQTRSIDGTPIEWVAGYGPNHWRLVQEQAEDRLRAITDRTSPRGGTVLEVEVRPGDTLGFATGERAEVLGMLDSRGAQYPVTAASGHEFYALSIKLDPNWQPPLHSVHGDWHWGVFMQLHAADVFHSPPAFALDVEDNFHVKTLAGDLMDSNGRPRSDTPLSLTNGELRRGHWVEFLIDVLWAYDNHGSLIIYRRDEGEDQFAQVFKQVGQPTLQFDSQIPNSRDAITSDGKPAYVHYWKAGFYRSVSAGVVSRLWLGPIVRGTSRDEVAVAAFGRP
jgi:Polysaccharide lyase